MTEQETENRTHWDRLMKEKKKLGYTVQIFRKNLLFTHFDNGIQLDVPRPSNPATEEEVNEILQELNELLVLNPNKVNHRIRWW